ncbi:MAG: SIS domain-containing protein [Anaerolineae bacterium]|nr:SIS domain-containing protein [Anaerolineae bacterium]
MSLKDEIFEQPAILERLRTAHWPHIQEVARAIRQHEIDAVFLAARGTSDHAGLYAKYLWGAYNRLPVGLATPSLFSIYERPPRLHRTLVVGISQSGQSPDIVSVIEEGRRQGAPTLAITNAPDSPLARASDWVINIDAGPERAVAATKTYTAQLMVIALLSVALAGDAERLDTLAHLPNLVAKTLEHAPTIAQAAERYRYMDQCVVLGRGYNYATAYEWALKLKELSYVVTAPYSSADFRHGPIAIVAHGFPVLAVTPSGAVFDDLLGLMQILKRDHQVELFVLSNEDNALMLADRAVPLPRDLPEWISPLVAIVPAQLFCYYLTRAKGFDTETPRGLSKVTKTQ